MAAVGGSSVHSTHRTQATVLGLVPALQGTQDGNVSEGSVRLGSMAALSSGQAGK